MQLQTRVLYGFGRIASKCADISSILFETGEIVKQAFHTTRREEADDIKRMRTDGIDQFIADGPIHKWRLKLTFVVLQPIHDLIVLLVLGAGIKELFILFMLVDDIEKAFVGAISSVKHLALAIEDEFLEIEGYGFCDAEILRILGHVQLEFLANPEEMINGVPAGEDYSGKFGDLDFLFPEILGGDGLEPDEWTKLHFN